MAQGFFITGTDTGIGKTWASVALMHYFKGRGLKTLGMKPVATGCRLENGILKNDDAILLQENASFPVPYEWVNPYAFEPPISPHIAAEQAGRRISLEALAKNYEKLTQRAECVVVEGVGGWETPLTGEHTVADLAMALNLPAILVVGLRLGCLNHALLSFAAIQRRGLPCAGWIGNSILPHSDCLEENIKTLQDKIEAPLMGVLPYTVEFNPYLLAHFLTIQPLNCDPR